MTTPITLVVDPSEEVREQLARSLADDDEWIGHDSLEQAAQAIDAGAGQAVVVLGPGVVHDDAIVLAESVRAERLPVGIVQVAKALEPDRLRDSLRAGVSDVVEDTAPVDELAAAIRRARDHVAAATPPPPAPGTGGDGARKTPVVAVVAGKGGVGASLVAANLAAAFGQQGLQVGLVDLDVRGGDLAIMFQQRPSLSVLDALDRVEHLDINAMEGYLGKGVGGVRLLAAPVEGEDVFVDSDDFDRLLGLVGEATDVIVVDVGDTFKPVALHVAGEADRVVVVTTLEVPAVRGTRRLLAQYAHAALPDSRTMLVANRADAVTGLSASDVEKTLDTSFDARIPDDKHASRSINEGDPLMNRRRSKGAKAISDLAARLAEHLTLAT